MEFDHSLRNMHNECLLGKSVGDEESKRPVVSNHTINSGKHETEDYSMETVETDTSIFSVSTFTSVRE